jgi:hypothetical protein
LDYIRDPDVFYDDHDGIIGARSTFGFGCCLPPAYPRDQTGDLGAELPERLGSRRVGQQTAEPGLGRVACGAAVPSLGNGHREIDRQPPSGAAMPQAPPIGARWLARHGDADEANALPDHGFHYLMERALRAGVGLNIVGSGHMGVGG